MANYATLIAAIQETIAANGNNEITGPILQQVLVSITNTLGSGYQFIGIATPETMPGTPDQRVFYIGSAGTYPNFGPAMIPSGSLGVFYYDTTWHIGSVAFPLGDGAVTEQKLATALVNKLFADGYKFAGIATPSTTPGTPDQRVFYIGTAGQYSNFGSPAKTVAAGYLGFFKYDTTWHMELLEVTGTIDIVDNLVDGGQDKALSAEQGKVLREIIGDGFFENVEEIDLSLLTTQNCTLTNTNKWYVSGSLGRHIAVPVTPGTTYKLKCAGVVGYWGLVTSSYSPPYANNSTVPFVSRQTARNRLEAGSTITFIAPNDAAFLILCTVDGGGLQPTWSAFEYTGSESTKETVEEEIEKAKVAVVNDTTTGGADKALSAEQGKVLRRIIGEGFFVNAEPIDLSLLTQQNCSLGSTSYGWYMDGAKGRHKAIPVVPGKTYVIKLVSGSADSFYGFLTNSYSPPYTDKSSIPYVSSPNDRLHITLNEKVNAVAPNDAAYLVINTVTGAGTSAYFEVSVLEPGESQMGTIEEEIEGIREMATGNLAKFRFAHWNAGHFSYYDDKQGSSTPDIPAASSDEMAIRYRKIVNEVDADILCICEDDPVFDAAGNTSIDKLWFKYPTRYQGTKYNYMCASIYTSLSLIISSVSEVKFSQTIQANRYYKVMVAQMNGKTVKIVETHLETNSGNGPAIRATQIQELINAFANDNYVILAGDFNCQPVSDVDPFIAAGYEMANHGYIGDLVTWHGHISPYAEQVLDMICVKGFRITNVKVNEESFDLSDHAAISCDLTMLL